MTRLLFVLLFALISAPAFGQDGTCKQGIPCRPSRLDTTNGRVAAAGPVCAFGANAAWAWSPQTSAVTFGWTLGAVPSSCTAANTLLSFSVNEPGVRANSTSGYFASGTNPTFSNAFTAALGSNTLPALGFSGDSDTGIYSPGANQVAVTVGGSRSMAWSSTAGVLNGTTSNSQLTLNDATGSELLYSSNLMRVTGGSIIAYAPLVQLNSSSGVQFSSTTATTSFTTVNSRVFQVDSNNSRFYWSGPLPTATRPALDFGGHPHPVLERRVYAIDMGYESTATPTWLTSAPRVAGATGIITVVDAAAAGAAGMGSSPGRVSYRSSVTLASAASISSLISSVAFVRDLTYAPRWCQKLGQFSAGTLRVFAGLSSALPGSAALPATHNVSFRYSTGDGDTKWMACYGAGATTCTATDVTPASSPGAYDTLCIDCREGSAACTWWVNGVAKLRQTTGLPTNGMAPFYSVEARSANAATLYAGPVSVEVN